MDEKNNMTEIEGQGKGGMGLSVITLCLLAAGIGLVFFGIARGDVLDVMNKAIRICYECIGIG